MDYPILENGGEIGRLYARQEGLYTVVEARLDGRRKMTRLFLCTSGGWKKLGVMEPGESGCRLIRRLSRRELPGAIRYAATAPGERRGKETPSPAPRDGARWAEGKNGVLYDRARGLVAIPAELRSGSKKVKTAVIADKKYIVFRW